MTNTKSIAREGAKAATDGKELGERIEESRAAQRQGNRGEKEPGAQRLDLTDEQFENFKERVNGAIHELVFFTEFMDQGDVEEAQNCLVTINLNLNALAEEYEALRKGAE